MLGTDSIERTHPRQFDTEITQFASASFFFDFWQSLTGKCRGIVFEGISIGGPCFFQKILSVQGGQISSMTFMSRRDITLFGSIFS